MLPGSGNSVVELFEEKERLEERQEKTLDCGCFKQCSCDQEEY